MAFEIFRKDNCKICYHTLSDILVISMTTNCLMDFAPKAENIEFKLATTTVSSHCNLCKRFLLKRVQLLRTFYSNRWRMQRLGVLKAISKIQEKDVDHYSCGNEELRICLEWICRTISGTTYFVLDTDERPGMEHCLDCTKQMLVGFDSLCFSENSFLIGTVLWGIHFYYKLSKLHIEVVQTTDT